MNYDNGSTFSGICTALALVLALVLGYHLRSWGWVINIDAPSGPVAPQASTGGKP